MKAFGEKNLLKSKNQTLHLEAVFEKKDSNLDFQLCVEDFSEIYLKFNFDQYKQVQGDSVIFTFSDNQESDSDYHYRIINQIKKKLNPKFNSPLYNWEPEKRTGLVRVVVGVLAASLYLIGFFAGVISAIVGTPILTAFYVMFIGGLALGGFALGHDKFVTIKISKDEYHDLISHQVLVGKVKYGLDKNLVGELSPDAQKILKVSKYNHHQFSNFTADEVKQAGYTAFHFKQAGFHAYKLKKAGFTLSELKDANFSDDELSHAGFNLKEFYVNENEGLCLKEQMVQLTEEPNKGNEQRNIEIKDSLLQKVEGKLAVENVKPQEAQEKPIEATASKHKTSRRKTS